jgi:hydroxyacylglutathione hydrolase
MALTVVQFRCLTDNYGALVHDAASGATAAVDAPDADHIVAELKARGWRLELLLVTHHHGDHTAGNLALKDAYGCQVVGPQQEATAIPGIDHGVGDGETLAFAGHRIEVLAVPGHTLGHVAYHFPGDQRVFVGDALFAMGCGRLFEGTAPVMWRSLERLRALPEPTLVHCGHDCAATNARFAATIEPDNAALAHRGAEAEAHRARGELMPPTTIGQERRTNPFLRADQEAVAARVGMTGRAPQEVFAEIRRRKDAFT